MRQMTIDFVSDVSCPWCAIGLESLLRAAQKLQAEVTLDLRFQPFQLNPAMGPEGQDIGEHLQQKYGASDEQAQRTRELIAARGVDVGFVFRMDRRSRIYNTFDAHRLLHWAGDEGRQLALKQALFRAYFTEGESPASHEVLVRAAVQAGLDAEGAHAVLAGSRFAAEVREREQFYHQQGIHSVPAIIVNGRHLIQGGQPPEVFEQALRQLASEA